MKAFNLILKCFLHDRNNTIINMKLPTNWVNTEIRVEHTINLFSYFSIVCLHALLSKIECWCIRRWLSSIQPYLMYTNACMKVKRWMCGSGRKNTYKLLRWSFYTSFFLKKSIPCIKSTKSFIEECKTSFMTHNSILGL